MQCGTYLMQIDTLAVSVDDPDTEDSGDGILPGLSIVDSVRTGERGWYGPPLLLHPRDGTLTRRAQCAPDCSWKSCCRVYPCPCRAPDTLRWRTRRR